MNVKTKWFWHPASLLVLAVLTFAIAIGSLVWFTSSDVTNLEIAEGEVVALADLAQRPVERACFFPSYYWASNLECEGDQRVLNPEVPRNVLFFTVISKGVCQNYSTAAQMGFDLNDVHFCVDGDRANQMKITRKDGKLLEVIR